MPYRDDSYCALDNDIAIAVSPNRTSPLGRKSLAIIQPIIKRKLENDVDEDNIHHIQFKIPRTGLSDLIHFTHLYEEADPRYIDMHTYTYTTHSNIILYNQLFVDPATNIT